VSVEFGGAEGGDGEGSVFDPVHAGAIESDADELFAGGFDHPRIDRPAAVAIGR